MRNLLLAICLVALLAGCNNSDSSSQAGGQPNTQQQSQQKVPATGGY
jgi:Prokaryotic membrane lipoprotein lipid attachment site